VLQTIRKYPKASGILICLVDQPLLTTYFFEKMSDTFQPGYRQIIVSQSASGWTGVPVLFDRYYFTDLLKLGNDEGAKKIVEQHREYVIILEACEMLDDIDSPESYDRLRNKFAEQYGI
jgi:molybdenum cofactor cytidylyltransferase